MRGGVAFTAGLLAGLWLDTSRRSARAEHAHPPAGSFVQADDTTLHYLERGLEHRQRRSVVFLHGNGILAEDWALSLLDQAAGSRHCIAFDRPGHGYSDWSWSRSSPAAQAAILRAGTQTLGLNKPIVVGHSLGAAVALAWALNYPDEVGGLLFLSGYAYPTSRPDFVPFMTPAVPVAGQLLSRTVLPPIDRLLLPALLRHIFAPNPVPPSYDRIPADLLLRPSQLEAGAAQVAALIPGVGTLASRYGDIRCPIAILAGEEDRIVTPADHAVRLHKDIPGSTLHLLAGVGHMVHHARPDAVLTALEEVERAVEVERAHARSTA